MELDVIQFCHFGILFCMVYFFSVFFCHEFIKLKEVISDYGSHGEPQQRNVPGEKPTARVFPITHYCDIRRARVVLTSKRRAAKTSASSVGDSAIVLCAVITAL